MKMENKSHFNGVREIFYYLYEWINLMKYGE